ncbi:hypothetical protein B9Z55_004030 [Caenorhabditis nigoni]|uniref:PDZ domain-containing protein n=1 Tax=Caenorhabditis nigoni TaxID=1611254 RepID=A0A2G5UUJ3_9PELO|nr:hypothetical protein B9Z55_004030 [Caenorhabditis nigoni]
MSGIENNNKENKKQQKALKKSKNGSLRKSVSGTKQAKNSAKYKVHKKRASQDKDVNLQTLEQRSEIFTSDVSEGADDKEEKTVSMKKSIRKMVSKTVALTQPSSTPTPPPTHFLPVVIQVSAGTFERFLQVVTVNRNLVITKVDRSLIHHFMPGDQITIVDGTAHWTIESLTSYTKGSWLRGKPAVAITVIRVWNINCITKAQYDLINTIDDRVHYFTVKLYSHTPSTGMVLCSEKKRILVKSLRAKNPASTGFIVGDQILGVNNEMYDVKKEKMGALKKRIRETIQSSFEKDGCVEVIACRLIGARSSPAPSLDAELAEKFAGYAVGVEKGINVEKKRDENTNLPFEADALEIALRELTIWRCYEGRDGFETPICDKGPSLLSDKGTHPAAPGGQNDQGTATSSSGTSTPSSSNTQVSVMAPIPIVKATSNTVMAEKLAVEKPTNKGDKPPSTPIAQTPRKRSIFRKEIENPQAQVTFKDAPENHKITSDVPEENEVKKCDARSGMIAYFKNIMK